MEYWRGYVSAELGDTLWVAVEDDGVDDPSDDSRGIVAWLSAREQGGGGSNFESSVPIGNASRWHWP